MAELLTSSVMLDVLRDLHAVFGSRMSDEDLGRKAARYHDALRGHDADHVRWAANQCVREDNFFPKPARLIELAAKRRAATSVTQQASHDARQCPICGSGYAWVIRYRVRVEPAPGGPIVQLTACGAFALLEPIGREVCPQCTLPIQVPHPDHEMAVMPVSQLAGYEASCRRERTAVAV